MNRVSTGPDPGAEVAQRLRQRAHRSRLIIYSTAFGVAVLFRALGSLHASLFNLFALSGLADLTALALLRFHSRPRSALEIRLTDLAWLVIDNLFVTLGVCISGGTNSPWYLWYLVNFSAASFILDLGGVLWVALGNAVAYLGLLAFMGDIHGLDDSFYNPLQRIIFLHVGAFFFVQGVLQLRESRRTIRQLREAETRKVEELNRLTAKLNDSARELAAANARIRAADAQKSRFLASMSHELRTPLNSIIGFSDILTDRLKSDIQPRHLGFLQNIHSSGRHLLELINDILDLSKIEAGRMELEPELFIVGATIEEVCKVMKGAAIKRGVTLAAEVAGDLPPLEADPIRVKQILYNLASNAVKFSPRGATVTIRADLLQSANVLDGVAAIRIEVCDRGPGIPAAEQSLIFEEFHQTEIGKAHGTEGTGLGLPLVRKFVEMHRGEISVTSRLGEGSVFTVLLPRVYRGISAGPLPALSTAAPGSSSELTVLVVEDDPEAFEAMRQPLAAAGYRPLNARSGSEALRLAREMLPAAITLDLLLPGMDGWGVLKALKADPATAAIPVIVVSVSDNRELGFALGVDDYFPKPADPDRLVSRLRALIPDSGEPLHVLVIDDEPDVHALIREMLEPAGFTLHHAETGEEGIAAAARLRPALVLLDLVMEGMNGFEVVNHLKADPKTADLPVIVFTSRDLSREDLARLQGKVAGLVRKGSLGRDRMVAVLKELLRKHRSEVDRNPAGSAG